LLTAPYPFTAPLFADGPWLISHQIALPNISKYLLNGHKAQQNIIQTIFQSVQLNINNPNFLIMQGRITKVCASPLSSPPFRHLFIPS